MPRRNNDNDKKLFAKAKRKQLTAEEQAAAERKAAEDEIAYRIKIRDLVLQQFKPYLTGVSGGMGDGSMSKASHLATMSPEGVAGYQLAELFLFFAQLFFNTPHLIHEGQFNALIKAQLDQMAKGRNVQLVYMPDENGVFPTVYVVDELTKEIDYSQTYENGQAPRDAIRLQGLVPKPDFTEGYWNAMNLHIERVFGSNALSDEDKLRLRNMSESPQGAPKAEGDKLRDLMIARNNQPKPRPGGKS